MKKMLFGLLIVGALSACTSSEKKMDIPAEVQTLNGTVSAQMEEYQSLKAETEELKMQIEELNTLIDEYKN